MSTRVDSIQRILPKERCFVPSAVRGMSPLAMASRRFTTRLANGPVPLTGTVCADFAKVDPMATRRVYSLTKVSSSIPTRRCSTSVLLRLCARFRVCLSTVGRSAFSPNVCFSKGRPGRFSTLPLDRFIGCTEMRCSSISRILRACCSAHDLVAHVQRGSISLHRMIRATLRQGQGGCSLRLHRLGSARGHSGFGICNRLVGACKCGLRRNTGALRYLGCCAGRVMSVPVSSLGAPRRGSRHCFTGCGGRGHAFRTLSILYGRALSRVACLRSVRATLSVTLARSSLTRVGRRLAGSNCVHEGCAGGGIGVGGGPLRCVSDSNCRVCIKGGGLRGRRLAFRFTIKGS